MKELYINNKRVILEDNTYIPFTQKVSVLDDFTIIGMPSTKSISIPRCYDNDEIFGHIASITRLTAGNSDNLIGISFNQIKKVQYKLYFDSELISEGIIRLVNITEKEYQIELYDKLIDLIETFSGDEGYMSDLDIVTSSGVFTGTSRADNIKVLNDTNGEIKVLSNIKDFKPTNKSIVTVITGTTDTNPKIKSQQLITELTPIQFGTLKSYDFEYAIPLNTVIRSINNSFPDSIEVDPILDELFDEVHLNLGSPIEPKVTNEYTMTGGTLTSSNGNYYSLTNLVNSLIFTDTTGVNRGKENGKYTLTIPFALYFYPEWNTTIVSANKQTKINTSSTDQLGISLGENIISVYLVSVAGVSEVFRSKSTDIKLNLITGINTFISKGTDNTINYIQVLGTAVISFEYYPEIFNSSITNYIYFDFTNFFSGNNAAYIFTKYSTPSIVYSVNYGMTKIISQMPLTFKSTETHTGTIINGSTLFRKISIKDFIINTAKYFNLGIRNNNGKLQFHKKIYNIENKPLLIDKIDSMEINNFDFSKLTLKTNVSDYDLLNEYEDTTNKVYGEQVINTGYKIKTIEKEIIFNVGIPTLIKDSNFYAYDSFTSYYNGGYNRHLNGITSGLDGIIYCYIHKINDSIWVSDDSYYEAGMKTPSGQQPTEISFGLYNEKLIYNTSNLTFTYNSYDNGTGSRLLSSHYTASPYLMNSNNNNVGKSLELNKPEYNWSDITDTNYPDNKTLYYTTHKKLIEDIYDVNCHILNVNMWIENKLDIYKVYNYQNTNYVISEITEYDPTESGIYQVKLLRVKDIDNYVIPVYLNNYNIIQTLKINGNYTGQTSNFKGFTNDIMFSKGTPDNFIIKRNILKKTPVVTYNGITTNITQTDTFYDVFEGDLIRKYKLINNNFYHTILNGGTLNFTDSNSITIDNSGSSNIKNDTISTNILIQNNGNKINQLSFNDSLILSVDSVDDGNGFFDWTITFKTKVNVQNGYTQFNSNSKIKWNTELFFELQDPSTSSIEYYWTYFDEATVTYSDDTFNSRRLDCSITIYGVPFEAGTIYDSINSMKILSVVESGYPIFDVSFNGLYTDTIKVNDNFTHLEFVQTSPSQVDFYNFLGNNDANIYATASNYTINYNYTKIKQ